MYNDFERLLHECKKLETISARMTAIREGKSMTWEQISVALYQIIGDIDVKSGLAKTDDVKYQGLIESLQLKKNKEMQGPGGYTAKRCNEGLVDHARKEIEIAGLSSKDADYDGMIGEAVLELMETFAKQGHSGFSAQWVLDVFERLAKFENLSPLTCDESEWDDVSAYGSPDGEPLWQSRRNPEAFSWNGGQTYYVLSELDEECSEEAVNEDTGEPYTYYFRQMKEELRGHPELYPMHTAEDRVK